MKSRNLNPNRVSKKAQTKRDHIQHYDLDGVTRRNGKIVIPSNLEVKEDDYGKSKGTCSQNK